VLKTLPAIPITTMLGILKTRILLNNECWKLLYMKFALKLHKLTKNVISKIQQKMAMKHFEEESAEMPRYTPQVGQYCQDNEVCANGSVCLKNECTCPRGTALNKHLAICQVVYDWSKPLVLNSGKFIQSFLLKHFDN